ncbi:TPA: SPOR domain-containing protein [Vibrio parahaemolyticus]
MSFLNKTAKTLLVSAGVFSFTVYASNLEELCRYTPLPDSAAPLLSEFCPLGHGLWGALKPKSTDSAFWIQCGVTRNPIKYRSVLPALRKLDKVVWNRKSPSGFHCLIGPYKNYGQALEELQQIKTVQGFKESALREIVLSELNPQHAPIHIQRQFRTPNYKIIVPISNNANYREKGEVWSRMTYQEADQVCHQNKMSLPDERFWKEASSSSIEMFESHALPVVVPYWSQNKQAYSVLGENASWSEKSLFNVLCISKA